MEHGNFKFDLNVSVSDTQELGTRTELKNLNSFRNAERALKYEIARQIEVLEAGQEIIQETRGWNDTKGVTVSQRGKEQAHDYRYFPEPDLPPLVLEPAFIDSVQSQIKDLVFPITIRKSLQELGLNADEQDILIGQATTREIFFEASKILGNKQLEKKVVNWLVGDYQAWIVENGILKSSLSGANIAELAGLVDAGDISSKTAKEIFGLVIAGQSPKAIVEDQGLVQISDDTELEKIVLDLIQENAQAVSDYKSGNQKAAGFFVGQVMQATKGQANPSKASALVLKLLEEAS
jgi:aspartyl-tRNA(Asn)/glutamyl-tRNA(Gln) amidotransferase subunit B